MITSFSQYPEYSRNERVFVPTGVNLEAPNLETRWSRFKYRIWKEVKQTRAPPEVSGLPL